MILKEKSEGIAYTHSGGYPREDHNSPGSNGKWELPQTFFFFYSTLKIKVSHQVMGLCSLYFLSCLHHKVSKKKKKRKSEGRKREQEYNNNSSNKKKIKNKNIFDVLSKIYTPKYLGHVVTRIWFNKRGLNILLYCHVYA